MSLLLSLSLLPLLLSICWLCNLKKKKSTVPNWPLLGLLPSLLWNLSHNLLYEFVTGLLRLNGLTAVVRTPCFILTCDPKNVHHILTKNFSNYLKGPQLKTIMEPLGDVVINNDGDDWKMRREIFDSLLKSGKLHDLLTRTLHRKLGCNLIPILDRAAASPEDGKVDLQDLMKRLSFDVVSSVILGFDPESLSSEFPGHRRRLEFQESFDLIFEVILYRHYVPRSVWKLQRWIGIGKAGRFDAAVECVDGFLDEKIRVKMERFSDDGGGDDLFREIVIETERVFGRRVEDRKFVREIMFFLMMAVRDTMAAGLSWFFWLVAINPAVERKILEEMDRLITKSGKKQGSFPTMEEMNKMVYLHGAISETMRLYPPVPFNPKQSLEPDILPSGHAVDKNTRILISVYSMGRMEEIWGEDCTEFKPERWVLQSNNGGGKKEESIVYVPPYKFPTFVAGPRACPGRQMAFAEMKLVACSVLSRFKIEVDRSEDVVPLASAVMFMKYGLNVRVSRRTTRIDAD